MLSRFVLLCMTLVYNTKSMGIQAYRVDLVFALDSSENVGEENFAKMREFCKDVVSTAYRKYKDVRVGVVTYSRYAFVEFHMNSNDTQQVLDSIDSISFSKPSNHATGNLTVMLYQMLTVDARPDADQIAVIIIDGLSNVHAIHSVQIAVASHLLNIQMYLIGIRLTETSLVHQIDPDFPSRYAFEASSFDELHSLNEQIFNTNFSGNSYDCNFDNNNSCSWTQDRGDNFDWKIGKRTGIVPRKEHNMDNVYAFISDTNSETRTHNEIARLISQSITEYKAKCLTFWYFIYAFNYEWTVNIYLTPDGTDEPIWGYKGQPSDRIWFVDTVDIKKNSTYKIVFEGVKSNGNGFIYLDDISVRDGSCSDNDQQPNKPRIEQISKSSVNVSWSVPGDARHELNKIFLHVQYNQSSTKSENERRRCYKTTNTLWKEYSFSANTNPISIDELVQNCVYQIRIAAYYSKDNVRYGPPSDPFTMTYYKECSTNITDVIGSTPLPTISTTFSLNSSLVFQTDYTQTLPSFTRQTSLLTTVTWTAVTTNPSNSAEKSTYSTTDSMINPSRTIEKPSNSIDATAIAGTDNPSTSTGDNTSSKTVIEVDDTINSSAFTEQIPLSKNVARIDDTTYPTTLFGESKTSFDIEGTKNVLTMVHIPFSTTVYTIQSNINPSKTDVHSSTPIDVTRIDGTTNQPSSKIQIILSRTITEIGTTNHPSSNTEQVSLLSPSTEQISLSTIVTEVDGTIYPTTYFDNSKMSTNAQIIDGKTNFSASVEPFSVSANSKIYSAEDLSNTADHTTISTDITRHNGGSVVDGNPSINLPASSKCSCLCPLKENFNINITKTYQDPDILSSKLNELVVSLHINKSTLSSSMNKKKCAADNRPSSKFLGVIGSLIIGIIFLILVIFDMMTFSPNNKKRNRKTNSQD